MFGRHHVASPLEMAISTPLQPTTPLQSSRHVIRFRHAAIKSTFNDTTNMNMAHASSCWVHTPLSADDTTVSQHFFENEVQHKVDEPTTAAMLIDDLPTAIQRKADPHGSQQVEYLSSPTDVMIPSDVMHRLRPSPPTSPATRRSQAFATTSSKTSSSLAERRRARRPQALMLSSEKVNVPSEDLRPDHVTSAGCDMLFSNATRLFSESGLDSADINEALTSIDFEPGSLAMADSASWSASELSPLVQACSRVKNRTRTKFENIQLRA